MSSISSRSVSHASISTLGHQWEPQQVLGLHDDGRCVGHAPSMGRKCRNPINKVNLSIFDNIVNELSLQPLDAALLRPDLERLARRGLCLRNHQGQVDDMVRKWVQKIKDAVCRLIPSARRTATDTQSRTDTRGTTDSFATARSNRTPGPRRANPSPPISSPPHPHFPRCSLKQKSWREASQLCNKRSISPCAAFNNCNLVHRL
ncbi:hypothetical protein M3J09_013612 [Ascochyta lentis]